MRTKRWNAKVAGWRALVAVATVVCVVACGGKGGGDLQGAYLEDVRGVRVLHLYGSDRQRGYANGYLMAEEILDVGQRFMFDFALTQMSDLSYAEIRTLLLENAVWPEEVMDEMEGQLQGIRDRLPPSARRVTVTGEGTREVELVDIMAGASLGDWTRVGGCSGFAAWSEATGGPTVHARNMDYPSGDGVLNPHLIVTAHQPDAGVAWVSIGVAGGVGAGTSMNENGLTLEGNDGGAGLAPSRTTGITGHSIRAQAVVRQIGVDPIADALALVRQQRAYVTQNLLIASPAGQQRPDDQVAAVFESDGNDLDDGATWRKPSETGPGGTARSDVIIMTNHMLKRVTTPGGADSCERYDEINRRVGVALDPVDLENPSSDAVIDAADARWVLQGAERASTLIFAVFEPDSRRLSVSFQPPGTQTPATQVSPVVLSWDELFP